VTIGGSVSVPDVLGEHQTEATVELYIDGQRVDSKTVTVTDGDTSSVRFSHQFDSEGSHEIELRARASYAGGSFSDRATTSIDVSAPEVRTPVPESTQTDVSGAAFPVPAALEDDVSEYRENNPVAVPHAFVLANQDRAYVVFSDSEPRTGAVSVSGVVTAENAFSMNGTDFGVVVADSARFTTEGAPVGAAEVAGAPGDAAAARETFIDHLVDDAAHTQGQFIDENLVVGLLGSVFEGKHERLSEDDGPLGGQRDQSERPERG
jgi:hypothetical protein